MMAHLSKKLLLSILLISMSTVALQAQTLLHGDVREFLDEYSLGDQMMRWSRYLPPRMVDGKEMVDAFVAIESPAVIPALRSQGVVVNCEFDGFVTAQIPLDRLAHVAQMPGVTDVGLSERVELCTDSTMRVTNVSQVLDGLSNSLPLNYDGSGVVVGVIDVGFDYQHLAFRRADDPTKSRIVRVYDTQDNSGHVAKVNNAKISGSIFMDDEILSLTTDDAAGTHGTHTSSIAAGTHVNGYGGMAPGADIVLCAVSVLDGSLSQVEIANCVRYIDAYADSVGKPCVISVSVSTANGQHDGRDYLSKSIMQRMGPGRIFVIAAGNNGDKPIYAYKNATPEDPLSLLFKTKEINGCDSSYYYSKFLSDIWVRGQYTKFDYQYHVIDQTTDQIVWTSDLLSANQTIDGSALEGFYAIDTSVSPTGYINSYVETSSDGKKYRLRSSVVNLVCQDYTMVGNVKHSRYAIGVTIWPRKASVIDAWVGNSTGRFAQYARPVTNPQDRIVEHFYTPSSADCSIGTYAVNDSIISAGSYVARKTYYSLLQNKEVSGSGTIGQISSFSSYQAAGVGPTGKALPTICAPGSNVVAAGNRYSPIAANSNYTVMKTDDGSCWCVMSGTSMAAPTVAGIIALWLQANPRLSVAQIKDIMANTAIHDKYTAGSMSSHFGANGKIDALAGIRLILQRQGYGSGDIDGSGSLTIDDVTALIDYLLSGGSSSFNASAADMDFNGKVTIDDVTTMIDSLLRN